VQNDDACSFIAYQGCSEETEELEQEICSILKRLPLRKRTELLTIMYHYVDENEEKEGE